MHFIDSLIKWKKPIMIVCLIGIIGSSIIAFSIDKTYESISTIYPSNPALTDKSYLFETGNGNMTVELYGSKEDVDRIISIAKSGQVLVHIINKFSLYRHYEVDTTKEYYLTAAMKKLKGNLKVVKTEFRGIEIKVKDKNPNLAAAIANEIVSKVDQVAQEMILSNRGQMLNMFQSALSETKTEMDGLTDSLTTMKKALSSYILMNITEKGKLLMEDMTRTKASLNELRAQREVLLEQYKNSDPRILSINAQLNGLEIRLQSILKDTEENKINMEEYSEAKERLKILQLRQDFAIEEYKKHLRINDYYDLSANQNVSFIYVMEKAYPAEKAVPMKLLIIGGSFLITLFMSIVTATIIDTFKRD